MKGSQKMGYYTDFYLKADNVSEKEADSIGQMLADFFTLESWGVENEWSGKDKWYDYESDMRAISEEFPDALFTIDGHGEDYEDIWRAWFKNGKMQFCEAQIVYADFDEQKMT